ncbi:MAG: succinate dehydrogenase assembly factor 2 [Pseudomonadota bacterium]
MSEDPQTRLKRLHMRSMRRGTKEMDILLMRFAEAHLAGLSADELDIYEALLDENDQDLYIWISGQDVAPESYKSIVSHIAAVSAPNSVAF